MGIHFDHYTVGEVIAGVIGVAGVFQRAGKLVGYIGIQGSAERHVDHLQAAADAQQRKFVIRAVIGQGDLNGIAGGVNPVHFRVWFTVEQFGVNIGAAGQKDTPESGNHFSQTIHRCIHRESDRFAAGFFNAGKIRFFQAKFLGAVPGFVRADGHTDAGFGHESVSCPL